MSKSLFILFGAIFIFTQQLCGQALFSESSPQTREIDSLIKYEINNNNYQKALTLIDKYKVDNSSSELNFILNYHAASCYFSLGNMTEAEKYYQEALKSEKKTNEYKKIVKTYYRLGWIYSKIKRDLKKATEYLTHGLTYKNNLSDKYYYCWTLYELAYVESLAGDNKNAIINSLECLECSESINEENLTTNVAIDLGGFYSNVKQFEKADILLKKYLLKTKDYDNKGRLATNVIRNFIMESKYSDAISFFQANRNLFKNATKSWSTINNMALAYCEINLDSTDKYAKESYRIAFDLKDTFKLAYSSNALCDYFIKRKMTDSALKYSNLSALFSKKMGLMDVYQTSINFLSILNEKKQDYKEAFKFTKQYYRLKDSLDNLENKKFISELTTKYEVSEKNKEIEILNKDQEIKNLLIGKQNHEIYQRDVETERKNMEIVNLNKDRQHKEDEIKAEKLINDQKEQKLKYVTEEKKLQDAIINQQKLSKNIISIGLVLVIFFSIYIFIGLQKNKKANKTITAQRDLLERTNHIIEEKHKEITDSINYAERIQKSFLAAKKLLDENLREYFVFFQPKDVVSGDFYWAGKLNNGRFALVTADSTGHGVPGAIMSLLNITSLEKAVENLSQPAEILNHTRNTIIERLKKDGSADGGKDGMDCSFISFDFKNNKLTYSAANNPVWIVRQNSILEFQPDKMPVGKHDKDSISFTQHEVDLQKGDVIYTITDGMPDQFGGPNGKKYKYKQLKELFVSIPHLSLDVQKAVISDSLNSWKGDLEQVDDITIIGVRI